MIQCHNVTTAFIRQLKNTFQVTATYKNNTISLALQVVQKDTFLMNLNGQGKSVMLTADLNLVYKKVPYCFGQQSQNQCPVPLKAQVKEQYVQKFAKVCIFFHRANEIKLSGLIVH